MAQRLKNRKSDNERIRDVINLNHEARSDKLELETDINDKKGNGLNKEV